MLVVQWWRNHLKNLRSIAQPGGAPDLGSGGRESESRYSDKLPCGSIEIVTLQVAYLLVPKVKLWKYSASCPNGNMSSNAVYREIYET